MSVNKKVSQHPLRQDAFFLVFSFFSFESESSLKWPKCVQKWSRFQIFTPGSCAVLSQMPTTDIFHMLAYGHGRRVVTFRPQQSPPQGLE